jgi:hypothetical protein
MTLLQSVYHLINFEYFKITKIKIERYKVSWKNFITILTVSVPVKQLFPIHSKKGVIAIEDSPHYAFVRNYLYGEMSRDLYRLYIIEQYGWTEEKVLLKMKRFEELIDLYVSQRVEFKILIKINSKNSALIFDGLHRASIVYAVDKNAKILCCATLDSGRPRK